MDLSKIIAELREELQCFDAAITSIEELARVQKMKDAAARMDSPREPERVLTEPEVHDAPPAKRRRGRPRKHAKQDSGAEAAKLGEDTTTLVV